MEQPMEEEGVLYEYEKLDSIPFAYGFGTIVMTVIIFQAVNQVVLRCLPSPKTVTNSWKWRNLLVSWIHAAIVGVWDLSCFYLYPELMTDLIAFHNRYLYTMVAFSTGYFVHDFIDIVVNKKLNQMWEVVPHHFAVAGMFFYNVLVSRCLAYNVVALLAEVNTIFLHLRKLLQMSGYPHDHPAVRINAFVNLFTFITCRFSGLVWIVGGMYVWGHRVTPLYFYILGASMFVMWVTNIALFWRLLSSDVIKPWRRASGKKSLPSPEKIGTNKDTEESGVDSGRDGSVPDGLLRRNVKSSEKIEMEKDLIERLNHENGTGKTSNHVANGNISPARSGSKTGVNGSLHNGMGSNKEYLVGANSIDDSNWVKIEGKQVVTGSSGPGVMGSTNPGQKGLFENEGDYKKGNLVNGTCHVNGGLVESERVGNNNIGSRDGVAKNENHSNRRI